MSTTAPTNLRVVSTTNNRIDLSWTASVDTRLTEIEIQYRFYLDGRFAGYTCSQYCFGSTADAIGNLAPGTTYRIGVEALGTSVSDITEITATTATPKWPGWLTRRSRRPAEAVGVQHHVDAPRSPQENDGRSSRR